MVRTHSSTLSLASLRVIWLTFSQIREFLVDSAGTVSGLSDREVRVIWDQPFESHGSCAVGGGLGSLGYKAGLVCRVVMCFCRPSCVCVCCSSLCLSQQRAGGGRRGAARRWSLELIVCVSACVSSLCARNLGSRRGSPPERSEWDTSPPAPPARSALRTRQRQRQRVGANRRGREGERERVWQETGNRDGSFHVRG